MIIPLLYYKVIILFVARFTLIMLVSKIVHDMDFITPSDPI